MMTHLERTTPIVKLNLKFNALKSNLYCYSDAFILTEGIITVIGVGATETIRTIDREDKQVILKICAPFTECISGINNRKPDNARILNVAMTMYNLIVYIENCSKTSEIIYHFFRDELKNTITDSESFKFK